MKTFTTAAADTAFKIDDDEFHPPSEVPAGLWLDLIKLQNQLGQADTAEQFGIITGLFEMVLPEDEYKVFEARLHDRAKPIGMQLLVDVIEWLLGDAYGMRPTPPPSQSPPSSTTGKAGRSSTAGARRGKSTRATSRGTAT